MRIYSPFHLTPEESRQHTKHFNEHAGQMDISDRDLKAYVALFHKVYRSTLEQFFRALTPFIPFYTSYPFKTLILRIGNNGIIIGHNPSEDASVEILDLEDFDPPLETVNIFEIVDRLQVYFASFDFRVRDYGEREAGVEARRKALSDALSYFWKFVKPSVFDQLCIELLKAEGIDLEIEVDSEGEARFDAKGRVMLVEPAGFRRMEYWGFEFKQHQSERVSAQYLRQLEAGLKDREGQLNTICLVTSGDLTSIGNHIAIDNPRIRVWDRPILQYLVDHHMDTLEPYFAEYKEAMETISYQIDKVNRGKLTESKTRHQEFVERLENCPTGQKDFSKYEELGLEILEYLFTEKLGKPKPQKGTIDRKQRRDVLFLNLRSTRFFERVADKFGADFVIVDFKNYTEPIGSDVLYDVEKYANDAIGRFILVVSRKGPKVGIEKTQIRLYRDRQVMVLAIGDAHVLEMVARKERGESPEDVLEDLLDEILMLY